MAADSGLLTILILLDLSVAFDTISHTVLIDRLASLGLSDTPLHWFKSYLSGRTQFVQLKTFRSHSSPSPLVFPKVLSLDPFCSLSTFSFCWSITMRFLMKRHPILLIFHWLSIWKCIPTQNLPMFNKNYVKVLSLRKSYMMPYVPFKMVKHQV